MFFNTTTGVCEICPLGSTQNSQFKDSCDPCPPWQYTLDTPGYCSECDAGLQTTVSKSSCAQCPLGYFKPSTSGMCQPCPLGTYADILGSFTCKQCVGTTNSTGSTSINDCIPCPVGNFKKGDGTCGICNPGTFSLNSSVCTPCPLGTYEMGAAYCTACKVINSTAAENIAASVCAMCPMVLLLLKVLAKNVLKDIFLKVVSLVMHALLEAIHVHHVK